MDCEEILGFLKWLGQLAAYTIVLGTIGLGFAFAFFVSAGGW